MQTFLPRFESENRGTVDTRSPMSLGADAMQRPGTYNISDFEQRRIAMQQQFEQSMYTPMQPVASNDNRMHQQQQESVRRKQSGDFRSQAEASLQKARDRTVGLERSRIDDSQFRRAFGADGLPMSSNPSYLQERFFDDPQSRRSAKEKTPNLYTSRFLTNQPQNDISSSRINKLFANDGMAQQRILNDRPFEQIDFTREIQDIKPINTTDPGNFMTPTSTFRQTMVRRQAANDPVIPENGISPTYRQPQDSSFQQPANRRLLLSDQNGSSGLQTPSPNTPQTSSLQYQQQESIQNNNIPLIQNNFGLQEVQLRNSRINRTNHLDQQRPIPIRLSHNDISSPSPQNQQSPYISENYRLESPHSSNKFNQPHIPNVFGIPNIGNSCYMQALSNLQKLYSLDALQSALLLQSCRTVSLLCLVDAHILVRQEHLSEDERRIRRGTQLYQMAQD